MSGQDDDQDKSHEPSQKKLEDARKKGEIARTPDLSVAAGYMGFVIASLTLGAASMAGIGEALTVLIDQAHSLAPMVFDGGAPVMGGLMSSILLHAAPFFLVPIGLVIAVIAAQRGFLFTLSNLMPKLSRISPLSNARNKFGRNGLFEFAKSFTKLIIYSVILALLLRARLDQMTMALTTEPRQVVILMMRLCVEFLCLVLAISFVIGAIDALWQHAEHMRKNRMSHKELRDEAKEAEGDPYLKQERRFRAQQIAGSRMMQDVPGADVVIVNPTHYAVALKWSRKKGSAPECVAKGVDEMARRIREVAQENGVPIYSDPPTARAIHATVEIGCEISPDMFRPVAAAIRFSEAMRRKARR